MCQGVCLSHVIIARLTFLVAVHSDKSKHKVSQEPSEFLLIGWAEGPETLKNVKGIMHFITIAIYNG